MLKHAEARLSTQEQDLHGALDVLAEAYECLAHSALAADPVQLEPETADASLV